MIKTYGFGMLLFLLGIYSCSSSQHKSKLLSELISGNINECLIPSKPSLRGVDILNNKIVWISGSKATFARSIDGGKTWNNGKIGNDTLLDYRDIHAFSAESAIAVSAGTPARIYKTVDGGKSWSLRYENTDSLVFFDSFDFCDDMHGIACSDPVQGNFLFIMTNNGGFTWYPVNVNSLPKPSGHEAGFAASGTSVVCSINGVIMFGTGGDVARVFRSEDYGNTWEALQTPIKVGDASYGIYSICPLDDNSYIITGGSWQKPDEAIDNVAISTDSGKSWSLTKAFPSGFRSCIKYLPRLKSIVTCGSNGVDISMNMGKLWEKTLMKGYNAVDISKSEDFIVFVGSEGKIAWVSIKK